jgi:hypothetical protein
MRFKLLILVVCLAIYAGAAPVFALADSRPSHETFDQLVERSSLIVVATIHRRSDGGLTLGVETVLKGAAAPELSFPPTDIAPPIETWLRAVIAFSHASTIDFRAPTVAWHVAADGRIDPERFQPFAGLPPTLDAMLAAFGARASASGASPSGVDTALVSAEPEPVQEPAEERLRIGLLVLATIGTASLIVGLAARRLARRR